MDASSQALCPGLSPRTLFISRSAEHRFGSGLWPEIPPTRRSVFFRRRAWANDHSMRQLHGQGSGRATRRRIRRPAGRTPARPDFPRAVEPRIQHADQQLLPMTRRHLGGADIELDARHEVQQPDDAPGKSLRVGDAISGQPPAQIPGLADIEHAFRCAAQEIHARPARERAKESLTQPLDERPGRIEKPELPGSHAPISTEAVGQRLSNLPASSRASFRTPDFELRISAQRNSPTSEATRSDCRAGEIPQILAEVGTPART
jgi:hypothetical protein